MLVPSTRPLVSTAAMTLSQGSSSRKLKLSARVPRPSYLSGQHCHVHVQISNDTHKTVRSLRLTLVRTTTVYRPQSGKGTRRDEHDHVSTKYQTKAFVDSIAENRLEMAERTTRTCASSKGWWGGVSPQERTGFTHSILIPVCPQSDIDCRQVGSFQRQMPSAWCTINCTHCTPRRRSRHPYYHLRFCGHARIDFAFVRHATHPHFVNVICGFSDLLEPSPEHAYGYPHRRARCGPRTRIPSSERRF